VIMHIMQLLQVIGVTSEQTTHELSVLYSMISPLGELPCNGVSYRPIYKFQLTGYATESNEKRNIFAVLCE